MRRLEELAPRDVAPIDAARAEETGAALGGAGVPDGLGDLLREVAGASPFLATVATRQASWLAANASHPPDKLLDRLVEDTATAEGETASGTLREARERTALLVALADIGGAWDLGAVTAALSRTADAACVAAWRLGVEHAIARRRLPPHAAPQRGGFVLALGKLGAGELNYSSDIDLICFFDRDRMEADDPVTGFVEAAKRFTQVLTAREDGRIVHRVDWRLRPDPSATPLAISTAAALNYYQSQARSWERLAFIKARVVAGDREAGEAFVAALEPFVWRRTLDFHVPAEMASIAARIRARGGEHAIDDDPGGWNVKTGRGGIREVEFLVQAQQTVLGGRAPALRVPTTRGALRALGARGLLDADEREALDAAYVHHRTLEHRLQMIEDAQTQEMPEPGERRARLAALMGRDEAAMLAAIAKHREVIATAFETVMGGEADPAPRPVSDGRERGEQPLAIAGGGEAGRIEDARAALALLDGPDEAYAPPEEPAEAASDPPAAFGAFARLGFADGARAARTLRAWLSARYPSFRSEDARRLAERRMPETLAALAATRDPDAALQGLDRTLARAPAGLAWHAMLDARPALIGLVARLAGEAPTLMEALARDPALLAEATRPEFWGPPEPPSIEARLRGLERDGALESAMDAVRLVNREEMFRLGCRVIEGADPYAIGDDMAAVTQVMLARLWEACLAERGIEPDAPLALLAMGRLGAREMTLGSDLDLIVLSDSHESAARDARFARTLVAAIGSPTGEGRFREVDMRLRPSGSAGPLVTPLPGFVRHHESAEAWEMIALGRARAVAGTERMRVAADAAIRAARLLPRDRATLLAQADAVLERVRRDRPPSGPLDLKNRPGGLFEIEFTVHLARILERREELAGETRTPTLIEGLREPDEADRAKLLDVHRALSALAQRLAVTGTDEAPDDLDAVLARSETALVSVRAALG